MTIKLKIKELLSVVKEAILNKDFSVTKLKEHTIILNIQGVDMEFWIANGADCFAFYTMGDKFLELTLTDARLLYKSVMEEVTPDLKTQEKREIKKQINRLKSKLEKIEKI